MDEQPPLANRRFIEQLPYVKNNLAIRDQSFHSLPPLLAFASIYQLGAAVEQSNKAHLKVVTVPLYKCVVHGR
jgi:hypothetical protein